MARACVEVPKDDEFPTVAGESPSGESLPFLLPVPAADALVKAIPRKNRSLPILEHAVLCESEGDTVRFATTDLEVQNPVTVRPIEGDYPDTDQVIPEAQEDPSVILDARLLSRACRIAEEFIGRQRPCHLRIAPGKTPLDAVRIDVSDPDRGELLLVVMPIRP